MRGLGARMGTEEGLTVTEARKQTLGWKRVGVSELGSVSTGKQLLSPKQDCPVMNPQLSLNTVPVRMTALCLLLQHRGFFWEHVPGVFWGTIYPGLCPSTGWLGRAVHTSSPLTCPTGDAWPCPGAH